MNISYGKQKISNSDIRAVIKALKAPFLTQGPTVVEFENAIAKYTGAKYAVAVSNATTGLHLAMLALQIKQNDEVITSPITFVASSNAALYVGAKVKFADIDEKTACIDPQELSKYISPQTKVIIPVHFAGQSCDMEKIYKIAKDKNIAIVEDAAHAIGSKYQSKRVGSCQFSDMAVFSFHAVKTITTGEGGIITTNSEVLYERLLLLRSHGITKDPKKITHFDGPWAYEMQELGHNYRITDFQAALGLSQLKQLNSFDKKRNSIIKKYHQSFADLPGTKFLQEMPFSKACFHLCIFLIDFKKLNISRKDLFLKLKDKGIHLQVHYIPVHLQPYYQKLGFKKGSYPKAENYYEATISLPLYPSLTNKEMLYFIKHFKAIYLAAIKK
jgi:UDP-4-amino-4,6-dideoxy-N-acetyl-beta-L-altrosamine transaminase